MADNGHRDTVNILGGDANLVHAENIVSGPVTGVENGEEVIQDILQQAFQEASGPYVQETAGYTQGVTLADGSLLSAAGKDEHGEVIYTLSSDIGDLPSNDQEIQCITNERNGNAEHTFLQQVVTDGIGNHVVGQGEHIVVQLQEGELVESFPQTVHEETAELSSQHAALPQATVGPLDVTQSVLQPTTETAQMSTSVAIVPKSGGTVTTLAQPLGSSNNPIRIVQQGSQYTSLQQLTSEQLSQIMQVVQQQQLVKSTQNPANDSAILYNPQTKTRIVYRVIYPSELHKRPGDTSTSPHTSTPTTTSSTGSNIRRTICVPTDSVFVELPKRAYRKRNKNDEDDKVDAPELSKEEKDEKKKHRPRTRSGRVSRPPKHMIKDYKHIHPVDWDEDYDDSDGGYSDFQPSSGEGDEEGNPTRRRRDGSYMPYSLLGHGKNKPWKCKVCDKAYIGKAGLARHYRLAPDHGKDDDNFKDTGFLLGADSSNSFDSMPGNIRESDKSYEHGEEDEKSVDKANDADQMLTSHEPTTCTTATPVSKSVPIMTTENRTSSTPRVAPKVVHSNGQSVQDNLGQHTLKGILKSKQIHIQDSMPAKKKARLKEFIRDFSDEDLMEVILPRLSRAVTTWEFLLMKVERGRPARPQLVDLLQEYAQLYRSIHRMTEQQLHPVTADRKVPAGTTQIQISDSMVATSLGLSTGMYTVEVPPRKEDTFRYKLLTADPDNIHNPSAKRTLQTVSSQELFTSPAKRRRIESDQGSSPKRLIASEKQQHESLKPGQTVLKPKITAFIQACKPQADPREDLPENGPNHQPLDKLTNVELREVTDAMKVEDVDETQANENQNMQPSDESPVVTSSTNQDSDADNLVKNEHIEASDCQVGNYRCVEAQCQENHLESVLPDTPANGELCQDTQQAMTESPSKEEPQTVPISMDEDVAPHTADMMDSTMCSGPPNIESQFEHRELTSDECQKQTDEVKVEQDAQGKEWEHVEYNGTPNQVQLEQQQDLAEPNVHIQEDDNTSLGHFDPHVSTAECVSLSMQYNEPLMENNISEQYITENGLILQDSSATQVLVQEESFLNQNGTTEQEHDLAVQGDGQDPNEDNRLILIKNPDGTIQIHRQGNQPISLEMLQALLGMELDIPTAAAETPESL